MRMSSADNADQMSNCKNSVRESNRSKVSAKSWRRPKIRCSVSASYLVNISWGEPRNLLKAPTRHARSVSPCKHAGQMLKTSLFSSFNSWKGMGREGMLSF